ncbi:MAG TPA: putative Ig domain-containing protein [Verrucomicrobiae bacterium]|nr:putative Ig domain-containing protein [Verrucomicrobiae bacterium]
MGKRAGCWLTFCLAIVACVASASCTGTPSDFNKVVLHFNASTIGPNQQVIITATVPADTTDAGVTWTFTPGPGAPADPGTFTSTTTQANYTSPNPVTAQFTVLIQATSIAIPSESNSVTITITPPQPLNITTTTLPNGVANQVYPTTQLRATGGVTPYTWILFNGTTLPSGLSLAADGTISGTPTTPGSTNFTVQVSDNEPAPMQKTANFTIVVTNALNGNYAFEFSGFSASGSVAIAGSFTADGIGTISSGVEDVNTTSGAPSNKTFTGTFTIGNDNRGTLTFTSLPGSPVFTFAIDSTGDFGRIVEFDASGVRGSGQIQKRTVSSCAANTLSGEYAFGLTGHAIASPLSAAGPIAVVGSFGATPPAGAGTGSIGPGESDANTPGGITASDLTVSGTFQTTAQSTRCTMALSQAIGNMNFSAYPVTSSEWFVVETDQVNASTPYLTSGKLLAQPGFPFSTVAGANFTATSIAGLTGQFLSGASYIPDLYLVSLTGTGSSTYTISLFENQGGALGQIPPTAVTFGTADQFGRLDSGIAAPIRPIFYMIGANKAFCINEILNDPFFGTFEPQSPSPFTASDLNGSFAMGTAVPAVAPVRDFSGAVTLANTSSTAGTINGTQDTSASGGNTAGQGVTGAFSGLSSLAGSGTVTLTAPAAFTGQFFVVSPTKIVVLTTTVGDTNPVLLFLGNCASTCGED